MHIIFRIVLSFFCIFILCDAQSSEEQSLHVLFSNQLAEIEKKSKNLTYEINSKLDVLIKSMEDSARSLMRKEKEMKRRMQIAEESLRLIINNAQEENEMISSEWHWPMLILSLVTIAIAFFTYRSNMKFPLIERALKRIHFMKLGTPNSKKPSLKERSSSFGNSWVKGNDNTISPLLRKVGV